MHALTADDIASVRLFPDVTQMLGALHGSSFALGLACFNTATIRAVLGSEAMGVAQFERGASLFGKGYRLRAMISLLSVSADSVLAFGDEIRDLYAAREAGCAFAAVG